VASNKAPLFRSNMAEQSSTDDLLAGGVDASATSLAAEETALPAEDMGASPQKDHAASALAIEQKQAHSPNNDSNVTNEAGRVEYL
jgi:hypothetical protein